MSEDLVILITTLSCTAGSISGIFAIWALREVRAVKLFGLNEAEALTVGTLATWYLVAVINFAIATVVLLAITSWGLASCHLRLVPVGPGEGLFLAGFFYGIFLIVGQMLFIVVGESGRILGRMEALEREDVPEIRRGTLGS